MRNNKKHTFRRVKQVLFSVLVAVIILDILYIVTQGRDIPVLDTQGLIANQMRDLIILTTALGMLIVIPVFIMLFTIAWKYRAGNTKAEYKPEFDSHRGFEALWWGVPFVVIIILAVITAVSTHALDPYKPISSNKTPVKIQVIALEWKWLFVYPDKGIATLNYVNIPEDTPIDLTLTSDAPMNSFWVPALAGQVYAMSGMSTKLHLMADGVGSYNGVSANISGEGFAEMRFKVNSLTEKDFTNWAAKSMRSKDMLTSETYADLAKPSSGDSEATYMLMNNGLYNEVIMKYMGPGKSGEAHS